MKTDKKKENLPKIRTESVYVQDGLDTSKARRLLQEMTKPQIQQTKEDKK